MTRARDETPEQRRARTAAARAASRTAPAGSLLLLLSIRVPEALAPRLEALTATQRGDLLVPHLQQLPEVKGAETVSGYIVRVSTASGTRDALRVDGRAVVYPGLAEAAAAAGTVGGHPVRLAGRLPVYAR